MSAIVENESHQEIISMGIDVVPLILRDLAHSPKHWFYALHQITGADPVPVRSAGHLMQMTAAWLAWGRREGLI